MSEWKAIIEDSKRERAEKYAEAEVAAETRGVLIATANEEVLKPRGVAVMIEAEHMCMSVRGVSKLGAQTVTTHFSGTFRNDPNQLVRFMTLLRGK